MNRYLSLVYLYYRACGKKLLIMAAFIPACTACFFVKQAVQVLMGFFLY